MNTNSSQSLNYTLTNSQYGPDVQPPLCLGGKPQLRKCYEKDLLILGNQILEFKRKTIKNKAQDIYNLYTEGNKLLSVSSTQKSNIKPKITHRIEHYKTQGDEDNTALVSKMQRQLQLLQENFNKESLNVKQSCPRKVNRNSLKRKVNPDQKVLIGKPNKIVHQVKELNNNYFQRQFLIRQNSQRSEQEIQKAQYSSKDIHSVEDTYQYIMNNPIYCSLRKQLAGRIPSSSQEVHQIEYSKKLFEAYKELYLLYKNDSNLRRGNRETQKRLSSNKLLLQEKENYDGKHRYTVNKYKV